MRPHSQMDSPEVVSGPDVEPEIHTVFETSTKTWQWIVADPETKSALIIDPVLDQLPRHQGISTSAADRILEIVHRNNYHVVRILETHSQRHCQTAAWYLRGQLQDEAGNVPRIFTGKSIAGVQRMFARQYRIADAGWNRHFDSDFRDGQMFNFGRLSCQVVQLDGNAFVYVVGRNVFLGEVPDESLRRRLVGFTKGYRWHPGGGGESVDDGSRPVTSATTASTTWSISPVSEVGVQPFSPLASNTNLNRYAPRPQSTIHEMAG